MHDEGACGSGGKAPFILNHCAIMRLLVSCTPQGIVPGGHLGGHQSWLGIFERERNVCPVPETNINLTFVGPCIVVITEKKPNRRNLLLYCTSYRFNMFQALLCPSKNLKIKIYIEI